MPTLKVKVKSNGALGDLSFGELDERLSAFVAQVDFARYAAARRATQVSQSSFHRTRDLAPARPGRHGTGQMTSFIRWRPIGKESSVGLALQELNRRAPHWIIQEIGTGERAVQRVGTSPNPVGRPRGNATYIKTVKSQVGRRISPGLVWATKGGAYSPPGSARGENLRWRSQVSGAPVHFDPKTNRRATALRIRNEIKGQHFVQKGGQSGFREYRETVLAAARSQLRKSS